jgi:dTDP-4-dehydrorhamnose 3,5-epimerase
MNMPFKFSELEIPDVILVKPLPFKDDRGVFVELYRYSDFARAGIREYFLQDNYSKSRKNVLRGLHYQKGPMAQGKLVHCLQGRILDVAVDIRKGSPTYGHWVSTELSGDNNLMLYIPPAFAHGFVVLSNLADVMYKCTEEYNPENDRGIIWNDPDININWPVKKPILSEKDRRLPLLKDADNNFRHGNS